MNSDLSYPVNPTPQGSGVEPMEPNPGDSTSKKAKSGCAGCLFIFFILLLGIYLLIFQSSIPLKLIAGSIEDSHVVDGRKLQIKGVGGSISRGVKIREIIIPGEHGDSTIKNLRFRYKKPLRIFTRSQFTLTEVSTSSADFIVSNDIFKSDGDTADPDEWEPEEGSTTSSNSKGFFELRLLKLQNTRLRSVDGSIDVNIPLIHMKGMRIEHNHFDIEEFEIKSNVLDATLADGRTAEVDGRNIVFDQRIEITLKPGIHESVIKDIPATYEFRKDEGQSTTRITAFGGAMDQVDFNSESYLVRMNSLSPLDYMKFENHVMPSEINLTARQKGELITMEPGSFKIGQTTFNFDGREFEESNEETIAGVATVGPYQVTAHLRPDKENNAWPPLEVKISSQPEASQQEILAWLYHAKPYDELGASEKAAIDKQK